MSYNPIPLLASGDLFTGTSTVPYGTTDLALSSAGATASVITGGTYTPANSVDKANDANSTTFWQPTVATNWSMRIDLGSAKAIAGWGAITSGAAGQTITLAYGSDGTTFTGIDTNLAASSDGTTLVNRPLAVTTARYWRLAHPAGGNLFQLNTFALYVPIPYGVVLTRIGIGTAGQSLKVVSGAPAWG